MAEDIEDKTLEDPAFLSFFNSIMSIICNTKGKEKAIRVKEKINCYLRSLQVDGQIKGLKPLTIKKYDVIRTIIGKMNHYSIVYKVDNKNKLLWVVPITTSSTYLFKLWEVKSRIYTGYYGNCIYFVPMNGDYNFCNIFDNKIDFNKYMKELKTYYKKTLYL